VFGGLGLLAWQIMRKGLAAGNLVFSPGPITNIGLNGINAQLDLQLIAQNTSSADLLLNSFAGNLFSNGTLIGNVSNFSGAIIPGNSQVPVPMTVTLLPVGVVTDLINAFNNKTAVQNIDLEGTANINGFQVAVPLKFSLNV
jgi:hypothetical protein